MMQNYFIEQMKKNKVLTNKSNKVDVLFYEFFSGNVDVSVLVGYDCYGSIDVSVESTGGLIIKYNNQILCSLSSSGVRRIPCFFTKGKVLTIEGEARNMCLYLTGGVFLTTSGDTVLPLVNSVVKDCGNKFLCTYEDLDSVINGAYKDCQKVDNCLSLQTFTQGSISYLGKITKLNGVYYSTSMDNYTSLIKIANDAESAIFVQNLESETNFFWLSNGSIYHRKMILLSSLEEENFIDCGNLSKPIELIQASLNTLVANFFGIRFQNDDFAVFCVHDDCKVEKIWQVKAKNIKIHQFDNRLIVAVFNDYAIDVCVFDVDLSKQGYNVLSLVSVKRFENVIDFDIIDSNYVLTSTSSQKFIGV